MHQTLVHRVCAFLQLQPPTLPASADELELAAAAALLAAFWRARTFCLYAFTNAGVGAPDELLSCVVFDAAGVAETLMRMTWPRDDAEACVMPVFTTMLLVPLAMQCSPSLFLQTMLLAPLARQ